MSHFIVVEEMDLRGRREEGKEGIKDAMSP
jgi:hypothetical protein